MKKILALVLALVLCVGLLAGCGGSGKDGGVIKIGYVNPYTGALAGNGEGCDWVVNEIETYVNTTLGGIDIGGTKYTVDVITYDSKSDPNTCGEMAAKLCDEDEVDLIVAIQTPETVIPVMNTAEQYGVPCIAIQAPVNPVAGNLTGSGEWTVHAFWTIEKVYEQYKALWAAAGYLPNTGVKVGLAFANDADGSAWHSIFTANLEKDGYIMVDPGQYPSGTTDFTDIVNKYKAEDIDILAGTNIPPDFLNLYTQVIAAGIEVGCVSMGKCCLLEGDIGVLEDKGVGIMTEVWWAPTNPYTSALTGVSCEALGAKYAADNGGRNMPQPAGYAYAALELAIQAFQKAGSTEKTAVRDAMKALDTTTIVGPIKYDQKMGNLTYSDTVIGGGQWQMIDGKLTLKIIDNTVYPEVPTTGSYVAGNATTK